jgi:hypothetical protein
MSVKRMAVEARMLAATGEISTPRAPKQIQILRPATPMRANESTASHKRRAPFPLSSAIPEKNTRARRHTKPSPEGTNFGGKQATPTLPIRISTKIAVNVNDPVWSGERENESAPRARTAATATMTSAFTVTSDRYRV